MVADVPITLSSPPPLLRRDAGAVVHHRRLAGTVGRRAPWPAWLPEPVIAALAGSGITTPWEHQVRAAEAAHAGASVAITTGTASGKSLAYLMPVLAATADYDPVSLPPRRQDVLDPLLRGRPDRRPTALYLAPTKALAHDQLRAGEALGLSRWRPAALDGDTSPAERDWVRNHASYVLTNPDMLHYSVIPRHAEWADLLRGLTFVVVDEAHHYRGVFGAHVAAVLGRLRRVARHYGADPVFVVASATAGTPGLAAASLLRQPLTDLVVVDDDASARPVRDIVVWQPEGDAEEESAALLSALVREGRQVLTFTGSRRGAERIAMLAQRQAPGQRVGCYRGGYLRVDRRQIERDLHGGEIRGLACTNALELGVDVSGVDAVIVNGFPGTRAAFWQQVGRAGRSRSEALAILVAGNHPVDRYLVDHPELLDEPVEEVALDPDNPYVLGPHLVAAAQELPLVDGDLEVFGAGYLSLANRLEREGALRRRPNGWYHRCVGRAVDQIRLRSTGGADIEVLEAGTGRVLEVMDGATADATVHPGAVYVHQGETYLGERLDHDLGEAVVLPAAPSFITQPRRQVEAHLLGERRRRPCGAGAVSLGDVEIHSQVIGYLRRDAVTHVVWDQSALDLPRRTLRTAALWFTLDPALIGEDIKGLSGGVHGAEHALVNLLPLFVPSDAWDVGGVAVADHPDTGQPTVIIHDASPHGAGFAARAYEQADHWVSAASTRVAACACSAGCPACVLSARCPVPQQPVSKECSRSLLELWARA